jgi:hypothetical protein
MHSPVRKTSKRQTNPIAAAAVPVPFARCRATEPGEIPGDNYYHSAERTLASFLMDNTVNGGGIFVMIFTLKGRSPMIEILTNASPFQVLFVSALIALVPFLAFYDPRDFEKKDPWVEKFSEQIKKLNKTKTGEKIPTGKEETPGV